MELPKQVLSWYSLRERMVSAVQGYKLAWEKTCTSMEDLPPSDGHRRNSDGGTAHVLEQLKGMSATGSWVSRLGKCRHAVAGYVLELC